MVERYFPTLKEDFHFYHVGPVKFYIGINIHDSENGTVDVAWEPVSYEADRTTEVSFTTHWDNAEERYIVIREKLGILGRKWKSMPTAHHRDIKHFLSDHYDILHEEVYKQLGEDLQNIVGGFHGI
jgi:hypothetical protein